MRKLGRMVRRVLTALSLLLFVAVLAAWVRGYWSWDVCWVTRESMDETEWRWTWWRVEWGGGEVAISRISEHTDADRARVLGKTPGVQWERKIWNNSSERVGRWYAGIVADIKSVGGTWWAWDHGGVVLGGLKVRGMNFADVPDAHSEWSFLAFPCWLAAIVFGALPSWRSFVWWRGVRRRLASREGRCPVCGYDLRASPGRCPECGTAVEAFGG